MQRATNYFFIAAILFGSFFHALCLNVRESQKTLAAQERFIVAKVENNKVELITGNNLPQHETEYAALLQEQGNLVYVPSKEPPVISETTCASITFKKTIADFGWDKLFLRTYDNCPAFIQTRAAGILEGIVTHKDISNFHLNTLSNMATGEQQKLNDIKRQFDKINEHLEMKLDKTSIEGLDEREQKYYSQVQLAYSQFIGVWQGQKLASATPLELSDMFLINADGQLSELETAFNEENLSKLSEDADTLIQMIPKFNRRSLFKRNKVRNAKEYWNKKLLKSRCSALVKLVKSEEGRILDVYAGHNTWENYHDMLRTYKVYDFQILQNGGALDRHQIAFSAYPGTISSTDDFYLANKELVIMETTLDIPNIGLFSNILPASKYIPDFLRVLAATRLSNSARDWVEWFSLVNTGTYNSQWMILDVKRAGEMIDSQKTVPGTFYVLEQMPGKITSDDMTDHLMEETYWASFNVPYFQNTRTVTGFTQLTKGRFGRLFSRVNNPRARSFRIYQNQVDSIDNMKKIMQLNKYKSENFESFVSEEDRKFLRTQSEQISARFDISMKTEFGGVDAKITNFSMMKKMEAWIIGGPSKDDQSPFDFSSEGYAKFSHKGVPDLWNFQWNIVGPENIQ